MVARMNPYIIIITHNDQPGSDYPHTVSVVHPDGNRRVVYAARTPEEARNVQQAIRNALDAVGVKVG